jgi:hypothetical protein
MFHLSCRLRVVVPALAGSYGASRGERGPAQCMFGILGVQASGSAPPQQALAQQAPPQQAQLVEPPQKRAKGKYEVLDYKRIDGHDSEERILRARSKDGFHALCAAKLKELGELAKVDLNVREDPVSGFYKGFAYCKRHKPPDGSCPWKREFSLSDDPAAFVMRGTRDPHSGPEILSRGASSAQRVRAKSVAHMNPLQGGAALCRACVDGTMAVEDMPAHQVLVSARKGHFKVAAEKEPKGAMDILEWERIAELLAKATADMTKLSYFAFTWLLCREPDARGVVVLVNQAQIDLAKMLQAVGLLKFQSGDVTWKITIAEWGLFGRWVALKHLGVEGLPASLSLPLFFAWIPKESAAAWSHAERMGDSFHRENGVDLVKPMVGKILDGTAGGRCSHDALHGHARLGMDFRHETDALARTAPKHANKEYVDFAASAIHFVNALPTPMLRSAVTDGMFSRLAEGGQVDLLD